MATQTVTYITPDEYLAAQRLSEDRAEYLDGVVCPLTGATINHAEIVLRLAAELLNQLRGRECGGLQTDMKVGPPDSQKFFYPDASVLCGEPQFHDDRTVNRMHFELGRSLRQGEI